MKKAWLKFVLVLTNRIYQKKQAIISQTGLRVIGEIFVLFFSELLLALISLPLYLTTRSEKVVAFFREKGTYEKVSYDYKLRRILTLTGVGVVFLIWLIKLSIIIFTPKVSGPMQLYKMINLAPADITEETLVALDTQLETAEYLDTIKVPVIKGVEKISGGGYAFSGTGQASSTIVLFLSDKQTAIYTDVVDKDGKWRIEYAKKDFKLSNGNHAIAAFCMDKEKGGRSRLSSQQYFNVTSTWVDALVDNVDIILNLVLVFLILSGIFLIILTI